MCILMYIPCILYCLLFTPTNAHTYILNYFISTSTCFSASVQSSGLNFVLPKVTYKIHYHSTSRLYMQPPNNFHILFIFFRFYHTSIHCFCWIVILIILTVCNFSKHKVKSPRGWCRSTETCNSTYKILLIHTSCICWYK